jgi:hypothetical protein
MFTQKVLSNGIPVTFIKDDVEAHPSVGIYLDVGFGSLALEEKEPLAFLHTLAIFSGYYNASQDVVDAQKAGLLKEKAIVLNYDHTLYHYSDIAGAELVSIDALSANIGQCIIFDQHFEIVKQIAKNLETKVHSDDQLNLMKFSQDKIYPGIANPDYGLPIIEMGASEQISFDDYIEYHFTTVIANNVSVVIKNVDHVDEALFILENNLGHLTKFPADHVYEEEYSRNVKHFNYTDGIDVNAAGGKVNLYMDLPAPSYLEEDSKAYTVLSRVLGSDDQGLLSRQMNESLNKDYIVETHYLPRYSNSSLRISTEVEAKDVPDVINVIRNVFHTIAKDGIEQSHIDGAMKDYKNNPNSLVYDAKINIASRVLCGEALPNSIPRISDLFNVSAQDIKDLIPKIEFDQMFLGTRGDVMEVPGLDVIHKQFKIS